MMGYKMKELKGYKNFKENNDIDIIGVCKEIKKPKEINWNKRIIIESIEKIQKCENLHEPTLCDKIKHFITLGIIKIPEYKDFSESNVYYIALCSISMVSFKRFVACNRICVIPVSGHTQFTITITKEEYQHLMKQGGVKLK